MKRLAALLLVAAVAAPLHGQVSQRSNLTFGTIVTGVTTSVAATSPQAASWRIHFTVGGFASFKLTLPSTLPQLDGPWTIPVSFCGTCGVYRFNNNNPVGGNSFNPTNSVGLGLVVLLADVYVWLGGSVSPPLSQGAGAYQGSAVLTLSGLTL